MPFVGRESSKGIRVSGFRIWGLGFMKWKSHIKKHIETGGLRGFVRCQVVRLRRIYFLCWGPGVSINRAIGVSVGSKWLTPVSWLDPKP